MRGHPNEISEALARLGQGVADRLSAAGWNRRLEGERPIAILTRPTPDGVMTVAKIDRRRFRWPEPWPVEVEVSLGIGYEPALNLMPLLTLLPQAMLITDPHRLTVSLSEPDTVEVATQQIVDFVTENAATVSREFPDAAAIDQQLQQRIADVDRQRRLLVLATMGRLEDTRALLATYPGENPGRDDRRFVRQLQRWLDAGAPVPPPAEDTLASLPRRVRAQPSSRVDSRGGTKAALDAIRAQSKGKTLEQLHDVVAVEYASRGITLTPAAADFQAHLLHREQQQRFGRARTALTSLRMLTAVGADAIRMFKHQPDDPEWLRPPDRASYPVITDRSRSIAVHLDAAAEPWLTRIRKEATRRFGPAIMVEVWLTREGPTAAPVAHIGGQRVGTVRSDDVRQFDETFRAAGIFDEDPVLTGQLTQPGDTWPPILEIPLPQRGPDVVM
jgi:hypothetical protein